MLDELKNTGNSTNAIRPSSANSRLLAPVIVSAGAVGLSIGLIMPLISIVLEQRDISFIAIGLNAAGYSLVFWSCLASSRFFFWS